METCTCMERPVSSFLHRCFLAASAKTSLECLHSHLANECHDHLLKDWASKMGDAFQKLQLLLGKTPEVSHTCMRTCTISWLVPVSLYSDQTCHCSK